MFTALHACLRAVRGCDGTVVSSSAGQGVELRYRAVHSHHGDRVRPVLCVRPRSTVRRSAYLYNPTRAEHE